ncbi:MAG: hypothetical protein LBB34_00520 [Holosporales bacterium]|jgi:hypothetical protein|nr:hypothetical protein [Holosporales bacterium]
MKYLKLIIASAITVIAVSVFTCEFTKLTRETTEVKREIAEMTKKITGERADGDRKIDVVSKWILQVPGGKNCQVCKRKQFSRVV